ncbi:TPA: WbqC family protein [Photobacterium damselae]
MKLSIMQPYLFPYVGYYQLALNSDLFVFFDDVNFFKKGYINRNNIMTKVGRQLFTLPVSKASQNRKINEHYYSSDTSKILSSIRQSYSKAPYFNDVYPIIESVLNSEDRNVSNLNAMSILCVFQYLNIEFKSIFSSTLNYDISLDGEGKIIDICNVLNANEYINAIGGKDLYHKDAFIKQRINLGFISTREIKYKQFNNNSDFESNLSIIDILMNESKSEVIEKLESFEIL